MISSKKNSYHLSNRQELNNFEGPISSFLSRRPQNSLLRIHSEMRNEILGLLGGQPFYLFAFFLSFFMYAVCAEHSSLERQMQLLTCSYVQCVLIKCLFYRKEKEGEMWTTRGK